MGAVKNFYHDEICNRCPECGVGLSEADSVPCDAVCCPIPFASVDERAERHDPEEGRGPQDASAVGSAADETP